MILIKVKTNLKIYISIPVLFVLLNVSVILNAQKSGSSFQIKLGIVSYTYRNSFKKDFGLTLDTIKNLGIKDIELSNLFGRNSSEVRKMFDDRGLICSSYGVDYNQVVNHTDSVARDAKILGAQFVRLAWIPHKDSFTLELAKKTVDDFNKVGKIFREKYGLSFCYHNHGYEFYPCSDGTLFDYIIQHTDPKYVSFEMDILWVVFPGADPVKLLYKYGNRFRLMHVKDLRKGITGNLSGSTAQDNDVTLGTGQIDILSVLKAANKSGIIHYYLEDESSVYYKQVPQSIKYLNDLKY